MLGPPLCADEQGAPRYKDLSRAADEVRRKDNRNTTSRPTIGAYRGRRREDMSMGELCRPAAAGQFVPMRLLEEGDAARRMVMEEASLLIVK